MDGGHNIDNETEAVMSVTTTATTPVPDALRRELLRLARAADDQAAAEAAAVPYWSPSPPSVQGHRMAATLLRATADELLQTEH
jgi:hypothetical protein